MPMEDIQTETDERKKDHRIPRGGKSLGGAKGGMYKNDGDGGKKIDSVKVKSSFFFLVFLSSIKHTINQCLLFLIIFFFHTKAK